MPSATSSMPSAAPSALYGVTSILYSNFFVKLPIASQNKDLANQTFIVTGANGGLGFESSLRLSQLGVGTLIMGVRTIAKGEEAKQKILKITGRPQSSIQVWQIDMDSYDSVKAFAQRASELSHLDGVLANAGIMTTNFTWSEHTEKTLNINVISTFLLYMLLLPKMRQSAKQTGHSCTFTIPNTGLHYMAPFAELDPKIDNVLDKLNDPETANMSGRYPLSKLVVLFVVRELAERSTTSSGKGSCTINTPNPSFCKSNLANESQDSRGFRMAEKILARSTEVGSRALIHGLLSGDDSNGQYLENCHVQAPACFVTGTWGQEVQKRIFAELMNKLDTIQAGISSNL